MTAPLTRRSLDPGRPISLTKTEMEIARLTVFGKISEGMARQGNTREGWPLTLDQAARDCGYKLKRARTVLDVSPEFNAYRQQLLNSAASQRKRAIWPSQSRSETIPAPASPPIEPSNSKPSASSKATTKARQWSSMCPRPRTWRRSARATLFGWVNSATGPCQIRSSINASLSRSTPAASELSRPQPHAQGRGTKDPASRGLTFGEARERSRAKGGSSLK